MVTAGRVGATRSNCGGKDGRKGKGGGNVTTTAARAGLTGSNSSKDKETGQDQGQFGNDEGFGVTEVARLTVTVVQEQG